MKDTEQPHIVDVELEYQMQARWVNFFGEIGAVGDPLPYFTDIKKRYSQEHRAYHTLKHVAHCLQELDEVANLAQNPQALEMALWFHDVVYEKTGDNEGESAAYAKRVAEEMGLPQEFIDEVKRLILATKHTAIQEDRDAQLLTDIDLAILGQNPEVFDIYEDNVRKEYSFVSDEAFTKGRSKVISSFQERDHIYTTEYFRAKYEDSARANLKRSLARWKLE